MITMKRFFALILTICLVVGLLPVGVYAEEPTEATEATEATETTEAAAETTETTETTAATEANKASEATEATESTENTEVTESTEPSAQAEEPDPVEVEVVLYAGGSETVTIERFAYSDSDVTTQPDANSVTMTLDSGTRLKPVTEIESGKQYLLYNNRAGKTLTATANDGGLELYGAAVVGSDHAWTITSTGETNMYNVQYNTNGGYLTLDNGSAAISESAVSIRLLYNEEKKLWLIHESRGWYGLWDYNDSGTTAKGVGYAEEKDGGWWGIYEAVSEEDAAYTDITFTGVNGNTNTTVVIGHVTYNITVTEYQEVDVVVYPGETDTITIQNKGFTEDDFITKPDANSATMAVTTAKKLYPVTSIESGKQYLIVNNKQGDLLTATKQDEGLLMTGEASVDSTNLWTIKSSDSGDGLYTVQDSASSHYLYVRSGEAGVSAAENVLQLVYLDGYWRIMQYDSTTGVTDIGLNDYQGDANTIAVGWTDAKTDSGSLWTIYEIGTDSEITFTGVTAGTTTTAIVGNVKYNITVKDLKDGEIEGLNNIIIRESENADVKVGDDSVVEAKVTSLDITAGVNLKLAVDLSDYEILEWSSGDPEVATVDENGNVTGVAEGSTSITATVIKDGIRKMITIPIVVRESLLGDGATSFYPACWYIDKVANTTVQYNVFQTGGGVTQSGLQITGEATEGKVIFYQRPITSDFGVFWIAKPDAQHALAFMASTNSAGEYYQLRDETGALGTTTSHYCGSSNYTGILNNTDWDVAYDEMLKAAAANGYDGVQQFFRDDGASSSLSSSLSFISEPLPTVKKTVNGILPITAIRADFRPYYDGMVATVDELIYYTITIEIPRPTVWNKSDSELSSITYSNVILKDIIDNGVEKADGSTEPLAYFYIQKFDTVKFDGILEGEELTNAINSGELPGYDGSEATLKLTELLNKEWSEDEPVRTLNYYVVYKIQKEDIPGNTITNTAQLTFEYKSTYSSGSHSGAANDHAKITVVGKAMDDYVIDFGLPFEIKGLNEDYGVHLYDQYTSTYGSKIERVKQEDGTYTITYTPGAILQGPDVITLIDTANDEKIVNGFIVYPATTVFYEEGFATAVQGFEDLGSRGSGMQELQIIAKESTNSENYGYTENYIGNYGASSGTQAVGDGLNERVTFQFTGTGVDIYANCDESTGIMTVAILNEAGKYVRFNQIKTHTAPGTSSATNLQGGTNYSLPVFSVTNLAHGTYTVIIQRAGKADGGNIYLDGYRIYNTMADKTTTSYYVANELEPDFVELRDYVLTAHDVASVADSSQYNVAAGKIMDMVYDADSTGKGGFVLSVNGYMDVQDLLDNGPKNEIYLWPGMSVTFALNAGVTAQIGLKAISGEMATCNINNQQHNIQSSIDMFYDISNGSQSNSVVIENPAVGGSGVIAITKLKVFGNTGLDDIFASLTQANVSYTLLRMTAVPVLDVPVITRQPVDTYAMLNEEMAVSLTVEGENLSYQWYWRNAGDEEFEASSCKTDTYYTTMTKERDGREIYCVITDMAGNQVVSDTATLRRAASTELKIVKQPRNGYAELDEELAVSLTAQGEGLRYQWYWRNKGEAEFQASSCKTDTYYTTMTAERDGREIYCVVTDVVGNAVTSSVVTLHRTSDQQLAIVTQPEDTGAVLNEDMAVSLEAVGEELHYQWYWRNAGEDQFEPSSCRTDTYYTTMTKERDGREIYCVITDALGRTVKSETVKLYRIAAVELTIVTQPVDTGAMLNEEMAVSLEAEGEGLRYQWYWRNANGEKFEPSSCRSNTYYTTMTAERSGREIYCVITDAVGNTVTSDTVTLYRTVSMELAIVTEPADTGAMLNEEVAVSLVAQGEGLRYQWYWRNANGEKFEPSSCKTDTYYTTMTKVRNGREIYCIITDAVGNTVTSDTVTLYALTSVELEIVTQPVDTSGALNEDMTISLEAVGEELSYQWYWRNAGEEEFRLSGCKTDTYYTTMTKERNGREIYCVITDLVGNQVVSDVVTLTMEQ